MAYTVNSAPLSVRITSLSHSYLRSSSLHSSAITTIYHTWSPKENFKMDTNSQLFKVFRVSAAGFCHDSAIRAGLVRSTTININRAQAVSCYESEYKSTTDQRLYVVAHAQHTHHVHPSTGARFPSGRAAFPGHRHSPQHRPRPRPQLAPIPKAARDMGAAFDASHLFAWISFEGRNYLFVIDSISRIG